MATAAKSALNTFLESAEKWGFAPPNEGGEKVVAWGGIKIRMGVAPPPPPPSYCGEGEIEKVLQIAVIKNLLLLLEISRGVAPSPFWAICGGLISFLFESFVPFRLMDLALAVDVFFVGKGSGCQLIRYLEGWGKIQGVGRKHDNMWCMGVHKWGRGEKV